MYWLDRVDHQGPLPERAELGPCWLWLGAHSDTGYASVRINRKAYNVHRLAYETLIGPVPTGLELDHLCRRRCCVNPWHLEAVTHQENLARGEQATKLFCARGHPRTTENTYVRKNGKKMCRICMNASRMRTYYRKKEVH